MAIRDWEDLQYSILSLIFYLYPFRDIDRAVDYQLWHLLYLFPQSPQRSISPYKVQYEISVWPWSATIEVIPTMRSCSEQLVACLLRLQNPGGVYHTPVGTMIIEFSWPVHWYQNRHRAQILYHPYRLLGNTRIRSRYRLTGSILYAVIYGHFKTSGVALEDYQLHSVDLDVKLHTGAVEPEKLQWGTTS